LKNLLDWNEVDEMLIMPASNAGPSTLQTFAEQVKTALAADAHFNVRNVFQRENLGSSQKDVVGNAARRANVAGAFSMDDASAQMFKDKTVVLFDDNYTSGESVREALRVLKPIGAKKIIVVVVGRAANEKSVATNSNVALLPNLFFNEPKEELLGRDAYSSKREALIGRIKTYFLDRDWMTLLDDKEMVLLGMLEQDGPMSLSQMQEAEQVLSERRSGVEILSDVARAMAKREPLPEKVGGIVIFGSSSKKVVQDAAEMYKAGKAPWILISGRYGKAVQDVPGQDYGLSSEGTRVGVEALLFKKQLMDLGVPEEAFILEDQSRTMTENAKNTVELLQARGLAPESVVFFHGPYHVLRGAQEFRRALTKAGLSMKVYDHAAYVPDIVAMSVPERAKIEAVVLEQIERINLDVPEVPELGVINGLQDELLAWRAFEKRVKETGKLTIVVTGQNKAGKTTLAKLLALRIGGIHYSSGSYFRAAAYVAGTEGIALDKSDSREQLDRLLKEKLTWSVGDNSVDFYYSGRKLGEAELESKQAKDLMNPVSALSPVGVSYQIVDAIRAKGRHVILDQKVGITKGTTKFADLAVRLGVAPNVRAKRDLTTARRHESLEVLYGKYLGNATETYSQVMANEGEAGVEQRLLNEFEIRMMDRDDQASKEHASKVDFSFSRAETVDLGDTSLVESENRLLKALADLLGQLSQGSDDPGFKAAIASIINQDLSGDSIVQTFLKQYRSSMPIVNYGEMVPELLLVPKGDFVDQTLALLGADASLPENRTMIEELWTTSVEKRLEEVKSQAAEIERQADLGAQEFLRSGSRDVDAAKRVLDRFQKAANLYEMVIVGSAFRRQYTESYKRVIQKLEAFFARSDIPDSRPRFVVVVPTTDRPVEFPMFLQSLQDDIKDYRYPKVTIQIIENSSSATTREENEKQIEKFRANGLDIDYWSLARQQNLVRAFRKAHPELGIEALVDGERDEAGIQDSGYLGRKKIFASREMTRLALQELVKNLPEKADNVLVWQVDDDEATGVAALGHDGDIVIRKAYSMFHKMQNFMKLTGVDAMSGGYSLDPADSLSSYLYGQMVDLENFLVKAAAADPSKEWSTKPLDARNYLDQGSGVDMAKLAGGEDRIAPNPYPVPPMKNKDGKWELTGDVFNRYIGSLHRIFRGTLMTRPLLYHPGTGQRYAADNSIVPDVDLANPFFFGGHVVYRYSVFASAPAHFLKNNRRSDPLFTQVMAKFGAKLAMTHMPLLHMRGDGFRDGVTEVVREGAAVSKGRTVNIVDEFEQELQGRALRRVYDFVFKKYGVKDVETLKAAIDAMPAEDIRKMYVAQLQDLWPTYVLAMQKTAALLARIEAAGYLNSNDQRYWWNRDASFQPTVDALRLFKDTVEKNFTPEAESIRKVSEEIVNPNPEKIDREVRDFKNASDLIRRWNEITKVREATLQQAEAIVGLVAPTGRSEMRAIPQRIFDVAARSIEVERPEFQPLTSVLLASSGMNERDLLERLASFQDPEFLKRFAQLFPAYLTRAFEADFERRFAAAMQTETDLVQVAELINYFNFLKTKTDEPMDTVLVRADNGNNALIHEKTVVFPTAWLTKHPEMLYRYLAADIYNSITPRYDGIKRIVIENQNPDREKMILEQIKKLYAESDFSLKTKQNPNDPNEKFQFVTRTSLGQHAWHPVEPAWLELGDLRIDPEMVSLGIDIGGTNVKVVVTHGDRPIYLNEQPSIPYEMALKDQPGYEEKVTEILQKMIAQAQAEVSKKLGEGKQIQVAGISLRGAVSQETGMSPYLKNLKQVISDKVHVPAVFLKDSKAQAVWFRIAKQVSRGVIVSLGTNVGTLMIEDGKISEHGEELGFLTHEFGRKLHRTFEKASANYLVSEAVKRGILDASHANRVDAELLETHLVNGDPKVRQLFREYNETIAHLVKLSYFETGQQDYYLTGGLASGDGGGVMLEQINAGIRESAPPTPVRAHLEYPELGTHIHTAAIGVALYAALSTSKAQRSEIRTQYAPEKITARVDEAIGVLQSRETPGAIKDKIALIQSDRIVQEKGVTFIPKAEGGKLMVIGDLHGDLATLEAILRQYDVEAKLAKGEPLQVAFLGDMILGGEKSRMVPLLMRVMGLLAAYPDRITITRGNHDRQENIPAPYTNLLTEVQTDYQQDSDRVYADLIRFFDALPTLLVTGNKIVAGHGAPPSEAISSMRDLVGNEALLNSISYNLAYDPKTAQLIDPYTPYGKTVDVKTFDAFMQSVGGLVFVAGHEDKYPPFMPKFNGRFDTLQSYGGSSPETHVNGRYNQPRFLVLPLDREIAQIPKDATQVVSTDILSSVLSSGEKLIPGWTPYDYYMRTIRETRERFAKEIEQGLVTFTLIKPDGVQFLWNIIEDLKALGFSVYLGPSVQLQSILFPKNGKKSLWDYLGVTTLVRRFLRVEYKPKTETERTKRISVALEMLKRWAVGLVAWKSGAMEELYLEHGGKAFFTKHLIPFMQAGPAIFIVLRLREGNAVELMRRNIKTIRNKYNLAANDPFAAFKAANRLHSPDKLSAVSREWKVIEQAIGEAFRSELRDVPWRDVAASGAVSFASPRRSENRVVPLRDIQTLVKAYLSDTNQTTREHKLTLLSQPRYGLKPEDQPLLETLRMRKEVEKKFTSGEIDARVIVDVAESNMIAPMKAYYQTNQQDLFPGIKLEDVVSFGKARTGIAGGRSSGVERVGNTPAILAQIDYILEKMKTDVNYKPLTQDEIKAGKKRIWILAQDGGAGTRAGAYTKASGLKGPVELLGHHQLAQSIDQVKVLAEPLPAGEWFIVAPPDNIMLAGKPAYQEGRGLYLYPAVGRVFADLDANGVPVPETVVGFDPLNALTELGHVIVGPGSVVENFQEKPSPVQAVFDMLLDHAIEKWHDERNPQNRGQEIDGKRGVFFDEFRDRFINDNQLHIKSRTNDLTKLVLLAFLLGGDRGLDTWMKMHELVSKGNAWGFAKDINETQWKQIWSDAQLAVKTSPELKEFLEGMLKHLRAEGAKGSGGFANLNTFYFSFDLSTAKAMHEGYDRPMQDPKLGTYANQRRKADPTTTLDWSRMVLTPMTMSKAQWMAQKYDFTNLKNEKDPRHIEAAQNRKNYPDRRDFETLWDIADSIKKAARGFSAAPFGGFWFDSGNAKDVEDLVRRAVGSKGPWERIFIRGTHGLPLFGMQHGNVVYPKGQVVFEDPENTLLIDSQIELPEGAKLQIGKGVVLDHVRLKIMVPKGQTVRIPDLTLLSAVDVEGPMTGSVPGHVFYHYQSRDGIKFDDSPKFVSTIALRSGHNVQMQHGNEVDKLNGHHLFGVAKENGHVQVMDFGMFPLKYVGTFDLEKELRVGGELIPSGNLPQIPGAYTTDVTPTGKIYYIYRSTKDIWVYEHPKVDWAKGNSDTVKLVEDNGSTMEISALFGKKQKRVSLPVSSTELQPGQKALVLGGGEVVFGTPGITWGNHLFVDRDLDITDFDKNFKMLTELITRRRSEVRASDMGIQALVESYMDAPDSETRHELLDFMSREYGLASEDQPLLETLRMRKEIEGKFTSGEIDARVVLDVAETNMIDAMAQYYNKYQGSLFPGIKMESVVSFGKARPGVQGGRSEGVERVGNTPAILAQIAHILKTYPPLTQDEIKAGKKRIWILAQDGGEGTRAGIYTKTSGLKGPVELLGHHQLAQSIDQVKVLAEPLAAGEWFIVAPPDNIMLAGKPAYQEGRGLYLYPAVGRVFADLDANGVPVPETVVGFSNLTDLTGLGHVIVGPGSVVENFQEKPSPVHAVFDMLFDHALGKWYEANNPGVPANNLRAQKALFFRSFEDRFLDVSKLRTDNQRYHLQEFVLLPFLLGGERGLDTWMKLHEMVSKGNVWRFAKDITRADWEQIWRDAQVAVRTGPELKVFLEGMLKYLRSESTKGSGGFANLNTFYFSFDRAAAQAMHEGYDRPMQDSKLGTYANQRRKADPGTTLDWSRMVLTPMTMTKQDWMKKKYDYKNYENTEDPVHKEAAQNRKNYPDRRDFEALWDIADSIKKAAHGFSAAPFGSFWFDSGNAKDVEDLVRMAVDSQRPWKRLFIRGTHGLPLFGRQQGNVVYPKGQVSFDDPENTLLIDSQIELPEGVTLQIGKKVVLDHTRLKIEALPNTTVRIPDDTIFSVVDVEGPLEGEVPGHVFYHYQSREGIGFGASPKFVGTVILKNNRAVTMSHWDDVDKTNGHHLFEVRMDGGEFHVADLGMSSQRLVGTFDPLKPLVLDGETISFVQIPQIPGHYTTAVTSTGKVYYLYHDFKEIWAFQQPTPQVISDEERAKKQVPVIKDNGTDVTVRVKIGKKEKDVTLALDAFTPKNGESVLVLGGGTVVHGTPGLTFGNHLFPSNKDWDAADFNQNFKMLVDMVQARERSEVRILKNDIEKAIQAELSAGAIEQLVHRYHADMPVDQMRAFGSLLNASSSIGIAKVWEAIVELSALSSIQVSAKSGGSVGKSVFAHLGRVVQVAEMIEKRAKGQISEEELFAFIASKKRNGDADLDTEKMRQIVNLFKSAQEIPRLIPLIYMGICLHDYGKVLNQGDDNYASARLSRSFVDRLVEVGSLTKGEADIVVGITELHTDFGAMHFYFAHPEKIERYIREHRLPEKEFLLASMITYFADNGGAGDGLLTNELLNNAIWLSNPEHLKILASEYGWREFAERYTRHAKMVDVSQHRNFDPEPFYAAHPEVKQTVAEIATMGDEGLFWRFQEVFIAYSYSHLRRLSERDAATLVKYLYFLSKIAQLFERQSGKWPGHVIRKPINSDPETDNRFLTSVFNGIGIKEIHDFFAAEGLSREKILQKFQMKLAQEPAGFSIDFSSGALYRSEMRKDLERNVQTIKQRLSRVVAEPSRDYDQIIVTTTEQSEFAVKAVLEQMKAKGEVFHSSRMPFVHTKTMRSGGSTTDAIVAADKAFTALFGTENYGLKELKGRSDALIEMSGRARRLENISASAAFESKPLALLPNYRTFLNQILRQRVAYLGFGAVPRMAGLYVFSADGVKIPQFMPRLGSSGIQMFGHTMSVNDPNVEELGLNVLDDPMRGGPQKIRYSAEKLSRAEIADLQRRGVITKSYVNVNQADYYLSWEAFLWLRDKVRDLAKGFESLPESATARDALKLFWVEHIFEAASVDEKEYARRYPNMSPVLRVMIRSIANEAREKFGIYDPATGRYFFEFVNLGPLSKYLHVNRPDQYQEFLRSLRFDHSVQLHLGMEPLGVNNKYGPELAGHLIDSGVLLHPDLAKKRNISMNSMVLGYSILGPNSRIEGDATVVNGVGDIVAQDGSLAQNVLALEGPVEIPADHTLTHYLIRDAAGRPEIVPVLLPVDTRMESVVNGTPLADLQIFPRAQGVVGAPSKNEKGKYSLNQLRKLVDKPLTWKIFWELLPKASATKDYQAAQVVLDQIREELGLKQQAARARSEIRAEQERFEQYLKEIAQLSEMSRTWAPAVTILGGRKVTRDHPYYERAYAIGKMLNALGEPVRDGASSGIMEAAFKGHQAGRQPLTGLAAAKSGTQGVQIVIPGKNTRSDYVESLYQATMMVTNVQMLTENMKGGIVFPGGYGTLHEWFHLWRNNQRYVLTATEFWQPIVKAFNESWSAYGLMPEAGKQEQLRMTDSEETSVDYARQGQPVIVNEDARKAALSEAKSVFSQLSQLPQSVVIGGELQPAGAEAQLASRLVSTITARSGASIRSIDQGATFNRMHEIAGRDGWLPRLQGLFLQDRTPSIAGTTEAGTEGRVVTVRDQSNYDFLLSSNAYDFVFLPGGINTMNNVFQILDELYNSTDANERTKRVYLVGRKFWQPIYNAIVDLTVNRTDGFQLIKPQDLDFIRIVDEDNLDAMTGELNAHIEGFNRPESQVAPQIVTPAMVPAQELEKVVPATSVGQVSAPEAEKTTPVRSEVRKAQARTIAGVGAAQEMRFETEVLPAIVDPRAGKIEAGLIQAIMDILGIKTSVLPAFKGYGSHIIEYNPADGFNAKHIAERLAKSSAGSKFTVAAKKTDQKALEAELAELGIKVQEERFELYFGDDVGNLLQRLVEKEMTRLGIDAGRVGTNHDVLQAVVADGVNSENLLAASALLNQFVEVVTVTGSRTKVSVAFQFSVAEILGAAIQAAEAIGKSA